MRRRASDAPLMRPPQRRRWLRRGAEDPLNDEKKGATSASCHSPTLDFALSSATTHGTTQCTIKIINLTSQGQPAGGTVRRRAVSHHKQLTTLTHSPLLAVTLPFLASATGYLNILMSRFRIGIPMVIGEPCDDCLYTTSLIRYVDLCYGTQERSIDNEPRIPRTVISLLPMRRIRLFDRKSRVLVGSKTD